MASVYLPTLFDGTAWYDFQCDLDGITFGFEFYWNQRTSSWYLNLTDGSGNPLFSGRKVVLGTPLFWSYVGIPGFPIGQLIPIDTSSQNIEAGLEDLGQRVKLLYMPAADVAAALAAIPAAAPAVTPPSSFSGNVVGNYLTLHDTHNGTVSPGDLYYVFPYNGQLVVTSNKTLVPQADFTHPPIFGSGYIGLWDSGLNVQAYVISIGDDAGSLIYTHPPTVGVSSVVATTSHGTDYYAISDETVAGNPLVYAYVLNGQFVPNGAAPPV